MLRQVSIGDQFQGKFEDLLNKENERLKERKAGLQQLRQHFLHKGAAGKENLRPLQDNSTAGQGICQEQSAQNWVEEQVAAKTAVLQHARPAVGQVTKGKRQSTDEAVLQRGAKRQRRDPTHFASRSRAPQWQCNATEDTASAVQDRRAGAGGDAPQHTDVVRDPSP